MGKEKQTKKSRIGHQNYEANRTRRAEKQVAYLENQASRRAARESMLENIHLKFRGKSDHQLRKMFGTLNVHRMTDILNDTWESSTWFKNRAALRIIKLESVRVIHAKKPHFKKFQKSNKKNKPTITDGQVQEVPNGPDIGSGSTQVD